MLNWWMVYWNLNYHGINEYKDQAYIYIGGCDKGIAETDILRIFSQYGIPVNILLLQAKLSDKSRAYLK